MRKRRGKVSVKAAAILLGAALLTAGCSKYQSSEEMRKGAENIQTETLDNTENETGNDLDEASDKQDEQDTEPTAEIIQSETERTAAPAPEFKEVSDTVYVKSEGEVSVSVLPAIHQPVITL